MKKERKHHEVSGNSPWRSQIGGSSLKNKMEDKKLENSIVETCLKRYNGNLGAVLIFGSYNTGNFISGKSDVDLIILFKEKNNMKFQAEQDFLCHKEFANIPVSIIHFRTLDDYKEHIYEEGSWSSWITCIIGSKTIYSTTEFEEFKKFLSENPIPKQDLLDYLKNKDEIELNGYFKKLNGWDLTKAYFSHLRRKLQILNYFEGHKLEFDYSSCLNNLRNILNHNEFDEISLMYSNRSKMNKSKSKKFYALANELTKVIEDKLK